jgi:sulfoacetaldehyde acetyltransferase
MNVSEALVEQLVAEDTEYVFGIIGSAFVDLADLFPPAGIEFVSVRHEQNAVHMADGYTRALNGEKPGVTIAQNGPGVTNMVTGLRTAQMSNAPIISLSPAVTRGDAGTDAYQEADTLAALEPVIEWQQHLEAGDRTAELVRTAFREALSEQGPANVEFPRDVLYENCTVDILSPSQYRQSDDGPAAAEQVAAAADRMAGADRPGIVVGPEVPRSGGMAAVGDLADRLNAPVATGFLNNDAFPQSHPLATGPVGFQGSKASHELLSESDLIVAIGTRLPGYERGPVWGVDWWPKEADLVQIVGDTADLGRSSPLDYGVVGDPAATAEVIVSELDSRDASAVGAPASRREEVQETVQDWQAELRDLSTSDEVPINPRSALLDIADTIPDDTIVTLDIGNIVAMARAYFQFDSPGNFIPAGPYGGIAFAWPAAIGASLARPDDEAIAIVGDGAFSTSLPELLTAVELGVSATACVMNNQQWGAEKNNQLAFYNERTIGADLPENPDFAEVARTMGAHGIGVEDPDEVAPALEEALSTDGPSVLDVVIDPENMVDPFRSDALKEPRRKLEKYRQPGDPNYEG